MSGRTVAAAAFVLLGFGRLAQAHSGPPFPIVSDRVTGAYRVSIWTDPDTTDDATPGGRFWVRVDAAQSGRQLPTSTRATVAIRPSDRDGAELRGTAAPVRGDVTNQFVALRMDHEGPYAVRVALDGPAGAVSIDAQVAATYDLRPSPFLLVVYVTPFILVGLLWGRLILRRRSARQR